MCKCAKKCNFESNLAMMVIFLPVKFDFDWTKHFRVRVQKQKYRRTENGQKMDGMTPISTGT